MEIEHQRWSDEETNSAKKYEIAKNYTEHGRWGTWVCSVWIAWILVNLAKLMKLAELKKLVKPVGQMNLLRLVRLVRQVTLREFFLTKSLLHGKLFSFLVWRFCDKTAIGLWNYLLSKLTKSHSEIVSGKLSPSSLVEVNICLLWLLPIFPAMDWFAFCAVDRMILTKRIGFWLNLISIWGPANVNMKWGPHHQCTLGCSPTHIMKSGLPAGIQC